MRQTDLLPVKKDAPTELIDAVRKIEERAGYPISHVLCEKWVIASARAQMWQSGHDFP
jgi:hypothetical protein